jgi:hypothetical protein
MKKNIVSSGILMIAAATLVSGCIVAPRPYGYQQPMPIYRDTTAYQQTYPDSAPEPIVAYTAPPPPQDEVIGIAPAPGFFWIGGIWLWQGGRHVWQPGHWNAPRAGFAWVPHRWQHVGNAWHLTGGHWLRR